MDSDVECVCCQEIPQILAELADAASINNTEIPGCIIDHPGFEAACLNRWVLRNAWRRYKQQYHELVDGPQHKKYRHVAYRQLVEMVWKYLGRYVRVTLPSRAVLKIRSTYPNDDGDGNYVGFKLPTLD